MCVSTIKFHLYMRQEQEINTHNNSKRTMTTLDRNKSHTEAALRSKRRRRLTHARDTRRVRVTAQTHAWPAGSGAPDGGTLLGSGRRSRTARDFPAPPRMAHDLKHTNCLILAFSIHCLRTKRNRNLRKQNGQRKRRSVGSFEYLLPSFLT